MRPRRFNSLAVGVLGLLALTSGGCTPLDSSVIADAPLPNWDETEIRERVWRTAGVLVIKGEGHIDEANKTYTITLLPKEESNEQTAVENINDTVTYTGAFANAFPIAPGAIVTARHIFEKHKVHDWRQIRYFYRGRSYRITFVYPLDDDALRPVFTANRQPVPRWLAGFVVINKADLTLLLISPSIPEFTQVSGRPRSYWRQSRKITTLGWVYRGISGDTGESEPEFRLEPKVVFGRTVPVWLKDLPGDVTYEFPPLSEVTEPGMSGSPVFDGDKIVGSTSEFILTLTFGSPTPFKLKGAFISF
jgi:hypothetical protein